jgi:hypothetical protein
MQKLILSIMAVGIVGLASLSGIAQAKDLKEQITIREAIWVNSTSVEPGNYLVKYDAKTGEATIYDGKRLVVTAKATIKTSEKPFASDSLLTTTTPAGTRLTGIRLGGQHEEIMFTDVVVEVNN